VSVDVMCHRHPDKVAGVRCQRCERPICPECMRQAAVGFQCPGCARTGSPSGGSAGRYRPASSRQLFRGHGEVVAGKVLIGLNVAAFVLMVVASGDPYGVSGPIAEHGVMHGFFVASGEWWRLFSGAFLHSGLVHLGMNMLLLWFLSQELEPALGRLQFLLLYVTALLGGSFGVLVASPLAPTVGASGAVFGLMGALIVFQLRAKQNPWSSGIGGLVLINVVLTFALPGISIGGHIGGLLAGAAAGVVLQPLRWPQDQAGARLAGVVALGVGLFAASLLLAPDLVRNAVFSTAF
jgi:membrane associated rhomboid family serine protease